LTGAGEHEHRELEITLVVGAHPAEAAPFQESHGGYHRWMSRPIAHHGGFVRRPGQLLKVALKPDLEWLAPNEQEARWQYAEIFDEGCYDAVEIPEFATVVDIGANTGLFTLFIKARSPSASIIAVEPMPEALRALRQNIDLHNLSGVAIHDCALGAVRESAVPFTYYPAIPGNSTRYPEDKQLQKDVLKRTVLAEDVEAEHEGYPVLVSVETTSAILPVDRRIDLIKVDVEGAELDVLRGIADSQWPLIDQFILEVQDLRGRLRTICQMLHDRGFRTTTRPSPLIPPDIRTFIVDAALA
jgi:FkbM family methyltransferase